MKRTLKIEIPGKPVPQERPFFVGRRAFDRPKSKARKLEVRLLASSAMQLQNWGEPRISAENISLIFGFFGAHGGADLDNLQKNVMDSLTGIVYKDDRQVVEIFASKRPVTSAEKPYTSIIVKEV